MGAAVPREGEHAVADRDNEDRETPFLPADHAFVVQFRSDATPAAGIGRAEHLVTGAAANFGSWPELRHFVDTVLASLAARVDAD
jgi:hypothetical protein